MSSTDPVATLLAELDRPAAPRVEFAEALLERSLRELRAPRRIRARSRRIRVALAAAIVFLLVAGIATATYVVTRAPTPMGSAPGPVRNGPLTIIDLNGDIATLHPSPPFLGHSRLRRIWRCTEGVECGLPTSLDWAPDGRRLALAVTTMRTADRAGLHVYDTVTGSDRHWLLGRLRCIELYDLDWSPDGSRLAYACATGIYVIGIDDSHATRVATGTGRTVSSPSWSRDGRRLAFATVLRGRSHVYTIRPDGTQRRLVASGATAPAWSPDGRRIAVRTGCGGIKLFTPAGNDMTPSRRRWTKCRAIGVPGLPTWSPDGEKIAIQTRARGIFVVNADGSGLVRVTEQTGRGAFFRARPTWRPRPGLPREPSTARRGKL